MRKWLWRSCLGMAGSWMGGASAWAADAPVESPFYIDARYRYSNLHSDGAPKRGHANTLRTLVGYHWRIGNGWSAYGEASRTWSLFGQQYDDGSGRRTPYPAEADPSSTGISNAWVSWRNDDVAVRAGRQYIRLDGGRFVSNNPWRQSLQSFDGVGVTWKAWGGAELRYYWLGRVNRTLGYDFHDRDQRRWKLDAHLLHVDQALAIGKLSAYGYFIRNDTVAAQSVKTIGVRWTGSAAVGPAGATLGWTADAARQHAYANNPARFSLGYHLIDVTWGMPELSLRLGEERLDGNGRNAINVAYGAARAFNGWVVAFRIPRSGLRERYVGLLGTLDAGRKLSWQVTSRHFVADEGGAVLGRELDAGVLTDLGRGFSVDVQFGDYRAAGHGVDERKLWLIGQYRFGEAPR